MNCIHPLETRYSALFSYSLGNPDLLSMERIVEVQWFVFIEIAHPSTGRRRSVDRG